MNSKDRYTIEAKKGKKKGPQVTSKPNILSQQPVAQVNLIPKADIDMTTKLQKSARIIKNEAAVKPLKPERSCKVLNNLTNKAVILSENYSLRPKTTITLNKNTKENQEILESIEAKFGIMQNIDPNPINKRWSDLPIRPSDLAFGNQTSSHIYIASRSRPDSIQNSDDSANQSSSKSSQKGHMRNNSYSKGIIGNEPLKGSLASKIAMQVRNASKLVRTKENTNLNNTGNSFLSQEAILEEPEVFVEVTKAHPTRTYFEHSKPRYVKPRNPEYYEPNEEMIQERPYFSRPYDRVSGLDSGNSSVERIVPREEAKIKETQTKEAQKILIEENNSLLYASEKIQPLPMLVNALNIPMSQSLPPQIHLLNNSNSGHTPIYANHNTSNISQNSNNKSFNSNAGNNQEIPGKKAGSGSSSYANKGGVVKTSKTQKTDSTNNSSNAESFSPNLDCDETLGGNLKSAINNGFWEDKFEVELKSSENSHDRGILRDITEALKDDPTDEELDNFRPDNNPGGIDSETINYLIAREMEYAPDPHYFDKKQSQVTWFMRAILLDWMMEVCTEFTLKRETYHYAVNYVDRYLSTAVNVQKQELQLIGVAGMYIAAKVEEIYAPKVVDFANSAANGYTTQQIMDMEMKMLKNLRWLLTPPTLTTWANWYMCQWDLYVTSSPFARTHRLILNFGDNIQFKEPNKESYERFREMMQLIDCALLESQTLQYKPRTLVAAFMYLILGKHYKQFTIDQIYEEFPNSSLYLLDQEFVYNDLFGDFLMYSFGFQLIDLLPSIQYVSTFFKLPLSYDLPTAAKVNKENVLEGHFEEFLAYQTHHPSHVEYIRKRPRNLF